jgi:nitrite reductase/ring-hydroxylating ferredoxin subunit
MREFKYATSRVSPFIALLRDVCMACFRFLRPSWMTAARCFFRRSTEHGGKALTDSARHHSAKDARAEDCPVGGSWVKVGDVGNFPAKRAVIDIAGWSVLLIRVGSSFVAVENDCPHLGSRLADGRLKGLVIECALHRYRWDIVTGQPVLGSRGQWNRPLHTFPVCVNRGRVLVKCPSSSGSLAGGEQ